MSPTTLPVCVDCGATLVVGHRRCWLCHRDVASVSVAAANPTMRPPQPPREVSALQFSLESLFLVTTLAAVCLGAFALAPGMGVLLAIVAVPALARTLVAGYRKKQAGVQLTAAQKVGAFLLSFGLMLGIGYAGCIAFCFVCLGTGLATLGLGADSEAAIIAVFVVSGLVALSVVGFLIWISRPRAA